MLTLYHQALSPFSRKVRLALNEKKLPFDLHLERTWDRREEFLKLNPAGEVPVLIHQHDDPHANTSCSIVVCDCYAICEYLEEKFPDYGLLGQNHEQRAETRRLIRWFDSKFFHEVVEPIFGEKVQKRFYGGGVPNPNLIRIGKENIHYHLEYIGWLTDRRGWMSGSDLSLADITAAAHLSCLDYTGDVPWDDHVLAKNWYARIKSRPSFRSLLEDYIPGMPATTHYSILDF